MNIESHVLKSSVPRSHRRLLPPQWPASRHQPKIIRRFYYVKALMLPFVHIAVLFALGLNSHHRQQHGLNLEHAERNAFAADVPTTPMTTTTTSTTITTTMSTSSNTTGGKLCPTGWPDLNSGCPQTRSFWLGEGGCEAVGGCSKEPIHVPLKSETDVCKVKYD